MYLYALTIGYHYFKNLNHSLTAEGDRNYFEMMEITDERKEIYNEILRKCF